MNKRIYKTPTVARVQLRLEETVLQSCKLSVPGPTGPTNLYCGGEDGKWYGMCKDATS